MSAPLTVLTRPVPGDAARIYRRLRRAARRVLKPHAPLPPVSPYPGHFAVVRSAVEGLRAIGVDFTFNPVRGGDVGETVYAPANEALAQAIQWKRSGRIRRLIAGPTNVFVPDEAGGIIRAPEIDQLIVQSSWVRDLHAALAPDLAAKLRVCAFGIDPDDWCPSGATRSNTIVVYQKDVSDDFTAVVEAAVRRSGAAVARVRYGAYTRDQFRALLDVSRAAVFLSSFETQGLALAEAWAMDVPTLVWDPRVDTEWLGHRFHAGSSAPYLTGATGLAWRTEAELNAALPRAGSAGREFSPRAWVVAHMTDAICARRLYEILTRDRE